jgi:hypothetical protein
MKRDSNWCMRLVLLISLVGLVFAASCGGKNGSVVGDGVAATDGKNLVSESGARTTGRMATITEDEIASLPRWQQELLADPGWNQPYITPRTDTPMPAPSHELLMSETQKAMALGTVTAPRVNAGEGGKGVSWDNQGQYVAPTQVNKGEYDTLYAGAAPYGCKDASTANGHSVEENIKNHAFPDNTGQVISWVRLGEASANHFTGNGGSGNPSMQAVYQLFSSLRTADPEKDLEDYEPDETLPDFAEISYRADGGYGSPGACAATAYEVTDNFWWEFNSVTNMLPGGNSTALYNILIAPRSEKSSAGTSSGDTVGEIQDFYLGNVSSCYGAGAIVGLVSTASSCAEFETIVNDEQFEQFFTNPIYGVLLQRWNDSVTASMGNADPWEADFGWPVFGPIAYNDGSAVLTGQGAYFAWGMFFEKGFVWWIDYAVNTTVPDEAQAYSFTGDNVYCADEKTYERLPTIFYGGQGGPLGVSVIVEASLNPDRGPGTPAPGTFYEVALPEATGLATVALDMHAHGYGGTPQAADCAYKHYTWAFRDGSIGTTNSTPFDNSSQYVTHTYGSVSRNQESVYIVRVQVIDAAGAIAYGDSLPIHVGHGGAAGGGEITIVRNDGGAYNANYDALVADLDALGALHGTVDYSATIADDLEGGDTKVVIWYRGGPGGGSEAPDSRTWTAAEIDNYIQLQADGGKVWLVSQNHGLRDRTFIDGTNLRMGWSGIYGYTELPPNTGPAGPPWLSPDQRRHAWAASLGTDDGIGFGGTFGFIPCAPTSFIGSPNGRFGADGTNSAERYSGANSSTKVPILMDFANGSQFCGIGYLAGFFAGTTSGPGFRAGVNVDPQALGNNLGFVSWGNFNAPDQNIGGFPSYQHTTGPGKLWITGYAWAPTTVTQATVAGMTRADLARNILAWLDGSLTFSSDGGSGEAKTNNGFEEYIGLPEIVSVTPAYWDEADHLYRAGAPTVSYSADTVAGGFPDQTMADLYRSTPNAGIVNEIVTTDPNNDWKNANDVDFAFPWYGYLDDGGNNAVEIGGTSPGFNATDDSVFYRGLLIGDTDASWARFVPAGTPSIVLKNAFTTSLPPVTVSGYYKSTNVGTVADDVYANYGSGAHAFDGLPAGQEWKNSDKLTVEAIAHWPATLKYFNFAPINNPQDASLFWSMYPGHNMVVPGTANIIGVQADWDAYRSSFDVDPGTSPSGRTTSVWNRPAFNFTNPAAGGRVVEFPYNKLRSWNPDLNRDGVRNNADKFPVRTRLFTNHQSYFTKTQAGTSVWPNHLHNPGLNPATTAPENRLDTFLEAGCYVVDFGSPIYAVTIADDPAQPNPGLGGTLTGTAGNYKMDFYYELKFGSPNYTVVLDSNYTGVFDPSTPNYGTPPADNTWVDLVTGLNSELDVDIPAAQPNGTYTMALRVTDGNGDTSTLVYPGVNLFPPQLLAESWESGSLAAWTLSGNTGSRGLDFINRNSAAPVWNHLAQNGSRYLGYNYATGYGNNIYRHLTIGPIPCSPNTNYTETFWTAGSSETGWDGLQVAYKFTPTNTLPVDSTFLGRTLGNPFTVSMRGATNNNGGIVAQSYGASGSASLGGSAWRSWTRTYNSGAGNTFFWYRITMCSDSSVETGMGTPAIDNIVVQ